MFKHGETTGEIIQAFYAVYNRLGYSFLEKVYENALACELKARGFQVEQQTPISVYYNYNDVIVGEYFADLLVEDCIIVEIKAVEMLCEAHSAQLLNYLKPTKIEVGLLLNFGPEPETKRKVLTTFANLLILPLNCENRAVSVKPKAPCSILKMLLQPTLLKKLDALSLYAKRVFTGSSKGEKRSTKRGSSVEFADFRPYNIGDDLRRIDWNAYGRFEKLFLKMFLEEEDLDITILIDASLSMQFGNPAKLQTATEIAGALGYIGLSNYDRVGAAVFDKGIRAWFPPTRGRNGIGGLFQFLEKQEASGAADLAAAAKRLAMQSRRSGIVFVISDFLYPEGYDVGLKTLAARGFEVTVIQLLDRYELEPDVRGDLKLVDAETGTFKEVSVTDTLLRTYKRNLDNYTSGLRAFCLRYGMNYLLVANDTPVETIITRLLRGTGVVK